MRKCLLAAGILSLLLAGCKTSSATRPTARKAPNLPHILSDFLLKDVDQIVSSAPLPEGKTHQVTHFGWSDHLSIHVVQARKMPAHYHAHHDETVYVRSGRGTLQIAGRKYDVKPGQLMHIPKGTAHSFTSGSDEPAVVISIVSPPSDGRDFVRVGAEEKAEGR